ncbi:hypothetical protein G7B40_040050 [Aetokthonos hydrillicola Thurmond2011]|jgi:hypothetical protein|uniref:Uncharacterized protein n=1 Tax=Aetokthonos hydrillicola Thurmond2011 TaxID=2712845 RepID=A0AAP5IGL1_9CYAN|nr:hypothetical protein [Aetokthonos hydrillicola]MBO3459923.1 hypothetical protein [Aetokthonos hydrillicola CCALA 1050]MBW4584040.1 hypothetical protein [Aetokthonos hydrillicola CCALA 1050]MDR9900682.1 hypothetical protein [Aetokthonos hydrillicola Thurmond2011]
MFKAIDVWKRLDTTTAVRYRCFQRLTDGQFCVQSADYYYLPIREEQVRSLDRQFLELFVEEAPDERCEVYPRLEEAIAMYESEFADDLTELEDHQPDSGLKKIA